MSIDTLQPLAVPVEPAAAPPAAAAAARAPRTYAVLALQAQALRAARASEAAGAVADELARTLGCDRVSIGFLPPGDGSAGRLQLAAVSHTVEMAPRQALSRALAAAMAEAAQQRQCIVHPQPPMAGALPPAAAAHDALARANGGLAIYTVPLHDLSAPRDDDGRPPVAGALLLERTGGFGPELAQAAQDAASFVGPLLLLRQRLDQPVSGRLADAVTRAAPRRIGNGRLALRRGHALALAGAAALLIIGAWPGTMRVVATARAEGLGQQVLAAPFDGYIGAAPVRPGAAVRAGEVLLTLQDRELDLDAARWAAESTRLDRVYREAQTAEDAAASVIAKAQHEQALAQYELAQSRLERTRLRAPFDGLLLAGDHAQAIGAAVKRGQELLTVAPRLAYRIVAEVDEAEMGRVRAGQAGQALFGAVEGDALALTVTRIAPLAQVRDGRNVFEVEARLDGVLPPALRPGLRGVVRLDAERAPLAQIAWVRSTQWLRQAAWRLFG